MINGEMFGITVPLHNPLKVGTLTNIIKDVAQKTGQDWMKNIEEL